ncbi:5-hydroxytryptamine receptor 1A-beta-like [Hemitrygon akajei]|uniref:5-hydroxytryptamine receptor 1A-beta-like n=1 Tax=Hemitrygon akajei TaxID=2704970 RepID=UPI003BFA2C81
MPVALPARCNETSCGVYIPLHSVPLAASSFILGCTCVIGVLGNGLACRLLYTDKSLRTPTNALLLNLAANDFVKCVLDIPALLAVSTWGNSRADLGETPCLLQPFTYSLSGCVQLATLVVISVERYRAIANPLQIAKRKVRIQLWLPVIWSMGFIVSVFTITLFKDTPVYVRCRHQLIDPQKYLDPFGIYILVPGWTVSLSVIISHYLRIFALVRQHNKRIFGGGLMPTSPKGRDQHLPGLEGQRVQQKTATKVPTTVETPCSQAKLSAGLQLATASCAVQCRAVSVKDCVASPPNIMGAVCLFSKSREPAKKRMEGKLAKRFGYIMLTFLVCWMPLVTVMLLNIFWRNSVPLLLEIQTPAMALSCIPAAVNPFIYTKLNQHFHSEIQQAVTRFRGRCKCLAVRT